MGATSGCALVRRRPSRAARWACLLSLVACCAGGAGGSEHIGALADGTRYSCAALAASHPLQRAADTRIEPVPPY